MSASISKMGRPVCALLIASANAVVVLPSPCAVLVTMNTLGAPSRVENCNAVRTDRYASANDERTSSCAINPSGRPAEAFGCCNFGTTPSTVTE
jgi:hypothetical protein